jgi:hypothetical protein
MGCSFHRYSFKNTGSQQVSLRRPAAIGKDISFTVHFSPGFLTGIPNFFNALYFPKGHIRTIWITIIPYLLLKAE